MKKIEDVIVAIDDRIDKSFGVLFKKIAKHFSVFSSIILLVLLGFFLFKIIYNRAYYLSSIIEQDVLQIAKILTTIDKNCTILSISGEHTPINFLTVKSFIGSSVGGLNLAYPQKWQGPYLEANLTHQKRFYSLVQTREGLFILPGHGVKLPNGLTIGKDIHIDFETSVKKMLAQNGPLHHASRSMGLQLNVKVGMWDPQVGGNKSTTEKLNYFISEFNQAMSFTKNTPQINTV